MDWNVMVFGAEMPIPGRGQHAAKEDERAPTVIGTRAQIAARILQACPDVDWSDPTWGVLDGDGYSLEIALGRDEDVVTFTIFARGPAEGTIMEMLDGTGWRALDTRTGDWLCLSDRRAHRRGKLQRFVAGIVERAAL